MTQTLDNETEETKGSKETPAYKAPRSRGVYETEGPIDRFVSELRRMTSEERIAASRFSMNRWERWAYAARYPDEVPLVNGELEWIALNLP
ncbi:MAG: hypothetical protein ACRDLL_03560 [Solirubrobacterales bacterium]